MVELLIGLFIGAAFGVLSRSLGGASKERSETPRPPPFDELLATLRGNLKLLDDELKNRRLSGLPQYIAPVEIAVDRTKKAIATAEGWT
ncbi:hypothetical protein HJB99_07770 [Rhizobium sp. NLR17b]|uniref:hypothetical protein n=1 Tax=Rhizobium sp. NLR17b TaxID=2731114 RepID=UPI001C82AB9A|nr:hypothetical protein [Rhizobium sp. NLR17b]MBX5268575.1 hypothetical protein [Rhizobium sp. NLR17b]